MTLLFEMEAGSLDKLISKVNSIKHKVDLTSSEEKESLKKTLQAIMFEDMKRRFASSPSTVTGGEVYGGEVWGSLSEWYLSKNPRRVGGLIYIDTQELRNSLISLNSNTLSEFDGEDTYTFGSRLKYADKLQALRPIIFMHPELIKELIKGYEKFLVEEEM